MSTDSHLERRIQDISKAKQLLNIPCVYKKQASFLRGSLGRVRKQKLLPSPPPLSQDLRVAELWKLKEQRNERMDVCTQRFLRKHRLPDPISFCLKGCHCHRNLVRRYNEKLSDSRPQCLHGANITQVSRFGCNSALTF